VVPREQIVNLAGGMVCDAGKGDRLLPPVLHVAFQFLE
jgi:hypothetical protein